MPAFAREITPAHLPPGTVVSVPVYKVFKHKGIVSDRFVNGNPMVISNSARAGGVAEEPWEVFAAGQPVMVQEYPSALSGYLILARARSQIGTKYRLLDWNCEHLVSHAQGKRAESPQVAAAIAIAVLVGIIGFGRAR
jgi:hypothetical protein